MGWWGGARCGDPTVALEDCFLDRCTMVQRVSEDEEYQGRPSATRARTIFASGICTKAEVNWKKTRGEPGFPDAAHWQSAFSHFGASDSSK